jgi:aldehyde:ferredoxin oxidoreductase
MIGGAWGRLLDVDLTRGRIGEYKVPEPWARRYLGGKGLAVRVLLEEHRDRDPYRPDNPLVFMTGPLVGQLIGGSGRHVVVTHSPLTGFLGEAYCGGFWGSEFKRTGWDGILIRGKSARPVYLEVTDDRTELHDAANLWGKESADVESDLRAKHGEGAWVANIGPAGENLVRFAAIMHDRNRAAARGGVGAVMGSKKLKAIVVRGTKSPPLEDPKRFAELRKTWAKTLTTEDVQAWGKYGTTGGVDSLDRMGILPTRNWTAGSFPSAAKISGETLSATILVDRDTCTACPVSCKRVVEAPVDGGQIVKAYGGPEYETIAAFGSLQGNDSLPWVSMANQLCNAYGLDTISTGNVIAWAMEASEKGLLPERIDWGDGKRACEFVRKIALREGVGDVLAEGVKRASERLGGADFAVHVKGAEMPMHEARGKKGLGLSYAVTPRGANHMEGFHDTMIQRGTAPDLGVTSPMDRFGTKGKAPVVKAFEDARSFVNCMVLCVFDVDETGEDATLPLVRDLVSAATGLAVDRAEMFRVGERAANLARLFAVRMGCTRKDDDLPPRIKTLALPFGSRREAVTEEELNGMISEYYAVRGWDDEGRPTAAKLRELGIDISV